MCEQILETIFIKGEKSTILETPFLPKSIVEISKTLNKDYGCFSTACYRGYIGAWEIKDNRLFLKEINGVYKLKSDKPVFANWYTGDLHIPGTQYSLVETVLKIKDGIVTNDL